MKQFGKKESVTLIIDVGTASVGGALLSLDDVHAPQIDSVVRIPIGDGTEVARDALTQNTERAFKKLLESYAKRNIHRVSIVVTSPWHEAHIRTIISKSERAAIISEKTVSRAVSRYQNEKPPQSGYVDVEAVAVQVQVQGYRTSLKRTVLGNEISISLYESEMREDVQKRFVTLVETLFPQSVVSFNTFPLAALIALRMVLPEESFIVLDIAGEMTELSIVHQDSVRHFASFPVGFYTIARAVSGKNGVVGDALSRLALLARGELSTDEAVTIQESLYTAFATWSASFDEALHGASEHIPIPLPLYLLSNKESLPWLLRGFDTKNTFSLAITPVITPLIQNFVKIGEGSTHDSFLALIALFFHTGKGQLIGEHQESRMIYSR